MLQCDAHVLQCVRSCSGDGQGTAVAAPLQNVGASAVCSVLQCVACVSLFHCACGCVQGARVAPQQNVSSGVCISVCIYVRVHSQIFMHIYTDLNISIQVYIYMYICLHICIYICIYIYILVYIYVYLGFFVCMCGCV